MSNEPTPNESGPRALIARDGRPYRKIAAQADCSMTVLVDAKKHDRWPVRRELRKRLMRALGAPPEFPLTINSVEECEEVLARLKRPAPAPLDSATTAPVG